VCRPMLIIPPRPRKGRAPGGIQWPRSSSSGLRLRTGTPYDRGGPRVLREAVKMGSETLRGRVDVYRFGAFRLDAAKRLLLRDGQPVPLTPRAFDTLLALLAHRDRVVEKDELMRLVWGDTVVEEANLTQNVFTLRKVLG